MLEYNEIKPRKYIIYNEEPYEVVESQVSRTQKRKPQNAVKLKSLMSGKVIPATFHASESAEEADISRKEVLYLYKNKNEFWFCDVKDKSKRFTLGEDIVLDAWKFMKENTTVEISIFEYDDEEKIIGIKLPVKVELMVTEAPPAIKGNTASGGDKLVTLETGAQITTPLFIETGTKVRINTETGEYVERA